MVEHPQEVIYHDIMTESWHIHYTESHPLPLFPPFPLAVVYCSSLWPPLLRFQDFAAYHFKDSMDINMTYRFSVFHRHWYRYLGMEKHREYLAYGMWCIVYNCSTWWHDQEIPGEDRPFTIFNMVQQKKRCWAHAIASQHRFKGQKVSPYFIDAACQVGHLLLHLEKTQLSTLASNS